MTGRKQIERQAAAQGWTITSIEWESIGAGAEMEGPSGGWFVQLERGDESDEALGYNAAQTVQWLRNLDRLDGHPNLSRNDPLACPTYDCMKGRGHRGEHYINVAQGQRRRERDDRYEAWVAEMAAKREAERVAIGDKP